MNFKQLISRRTFNGLSRINGRVLSSYENLSPTIYSSSGRNTSVFVRSIDITTPFKYFKRYIHIQSSKEFEVSQERIGPKLGSGDSEEEDGTMNEFLSRFVWIMRGKISEAYPDCDKQTVDGMLLVIVGKVVDEMEKGGIEQMLEATVGMPSQEFSDELWKTVWEVSHMVLQDMQKARKKEKMKQFLQSKEVKELSRFASEIGIRGDMLRELQIKWATKQIERGEFYEDLERHRQQEKDKERTVLDVNNTELVAEDKPKVVSLPKRKGKIKYKIYGLDLSDPNWSEVADKLHEREEMIFSKEPKPITGKCKQALEKIILLEEDDDPSTVLAEWIDLLQPSRVDWISLLDRLKEQSGALYLKVAETVLNEKSFEANMHDYTKLIDAHANEGRVEDTERILKKMTENGIMPSVLNAVTLVHMYCKAGNIERAQQTFDTIRSRGFQPDTKVYNSMIMAYVNAGQPKLAESLVRDMEARDIKPSKEIYLALLRSFSQLGDVGGAGRISATMQFAGYEPTVECYTYLVEVYGKAGDPDQARSNFDHMLKLGHKPNDRCVASMITAYEKKNLLDKALNLLMELEKYGIEPGTATYTVLVDWMGELLLIDEAEQLLGKVAQLGEAPPFNIQVTLCAMYAKAGVERKALQALGILEARKEELSSDQFERIISALAAGGFVQDAKRVQGLMEAQGFVASERLKMSLMSSQTVNRERPAMR